MLAKPAGEAGDKRKGFILIDAMELGDGGSIKLDEGNEEVDKRALYTQIIVRTNLILARHISHLSSSCFLRTLPTSPATLRTST